jgi:hypothetical protein
VSDRGEPSLDALSLASTRLHPDDVAAVARSEAAKLGADDLRIVLADLEQRVLVPLRAPGEVDAGPLGIESTSAGRAYRTESAVLPDADDDVLWLPLLDSAERLGAVGVRVRGQLDEARLQELSAFTNLLAEILANKASYGDVIAQTRRTRDLSVSAEIRWAMLPPLTFKGRNVTISGVLEPAYDIAGDTFDYAVNGDDAFVAIFDAVGHDLEAARIANLAVLSYRHGRRRGLGAVETYLAMDEVLASQFGDDKFATAQLARLTLSTGELTWINAGHPPPMVVRRGHRIDLGSEVSLPVGLAAVHGSTDVVEASVRLEPHDLVLFFTDGVVEARSASGEEFGRDRLGDLVEDAVAAGQTVAETMRMLGLAVLDHQPGELADDASLVGLAWHGPPS